MKRRLFSLLIAAALLLAAAASARAANLYEISWFSLASGGRSTGETYTLDGAIGQSSAESSQNGTETLSSGFLDGAASVR